MCSLTTERVSWRQTCAGAHCHAAIVPCVSIKNVLSSYGTCSLTSDMELIDTLPSYYRMCSLTRECVLLLQNMFSYYRCGAHWHAAIVPCASQYRTQYLPIESVLQIECILFLQTVFSYSWYAAELIEGHAALVPSKGTSAAWPSMSSAALC